jgi:hypothetical protein
MSLLKISDPVALQLLMTEELYHVKSDAIIPALQQPESPLRSEPPQEPKVEIPVITPIEPSKAEPIYFEYLGDNNKYILILVDEPAHPVIEPKELETLLNILKGKKQELKDVAVLNLKKYPSASFDQLKSFFACSSIVLFGINPGRLGIPGMNANQITPFKETKILATFSISEMLGNVDKKRTFWEEMKKL